MRRRILDLVFAMILVVSLASATALASTTKSYGTSTRQYIATVTNHTENSGTVYAKLIPAPATPAAVLQICDQSGTVVLKSKTYPAYPLNPEYTTCYVGPDGDYRKIYVVPYSSGNYVSGTVEYYLSV